MQVGRKVAQVLESLGRSAETIQEAEVGSFVTNIITAGPVNSEDTEGIHLLVPAQVRRFCKESRNLRVQRGSNILEEFNQPSNREWRVARKQPKVIKNF